METIQKLGEEFLEDNGYSISLKNPDTNSIFNEKVQEILEDPTSEDFGINKGNKEMIVNLIKNWDESPRRGTDIPYLLSGLMNLGNFKDIKKRKVIYENGLTGLDTVTKIILGEEVSHIDIFNFYERILRKELCGFVPKISDGELFDDEVISEFNRKFLLNEDYVEDISNKNEEYISGSANLSDKHLNEKIWNYVNHEANKIYKSFNEDISTFIEDRKSDKTYIYISDDDMRKIESSFAELYSGRVMKIVERAYQICK